MTTTFYVSNPWAWSWCPPSSNPVTEDPDITDGTHEYPETPLWLDVFGAVTAAVREAEMPLTAEMPEETTVTIPFDSTRCHAKWPKTG